MRLRTGFQRRRAAIERARVAAVPDVVRDKAAAEQQMRFYDELGDKARAAVRATRFDADTVGWWRKLFTGELKDEQLAERIRADDDKYSGRAGAPPAPRGI